MLEQLRIYELGQLLIFEATILKLLAELTLE